MGRRLPLRGCRERKTGHGSATQGLVLEKLRLHARFNRPVISFSRVILGSFLFNERLVQAQIVADAVLPAGITVLVIGKGIRDPFVDLGQSQPPVSRSENRHPNQCRVTVRRLRAIIFDRRHFFRLR